MRIVKITDPTTGQMQSVISQSEPELLENLQFNVDEQHSVMASLVGKIFIFSILYLATLAAIWIFTSPQLTIVVLVMTLLVCAWVPIWINPYKQWLRGWIRACMWSNQLKRLQAARQSASSPEE